MWPVVLHHLTAERVSRLTGYSSAAYLLPQTWSQHSAIRGIHLILERHVRR